jgi:hypothetical protein
VIHDARVRHVAGPDGARPDLPQMEMLRALSSRSWPEAELATSGDPRRSGWHVRAGQCPLAGCEAISTAATDDPVGMRNGLIQINAAARLLPKNWRMAFDPRRASIIDKARIATGTCVALIGYLAYVLISIPTTA